MTTTTVIITLATLLILGVAMLVISQMRERARIERMRRVKALEDSHSLLRRFIDELPASYLDRSLQRIILERALELAIKLRELGAPGNVNARIESDQAALTAFEAGQMGGVDESAINNPTRVKETRHLLQLLYRFVERQKNAGSLSAGAAQEQLKNIVFLVHKCYADLRVAEAQEHYHNQKYRRAIHCYYLAASELDKAKDHPQAQNLAQQYRERIKALNEVADGGAKKEQDAAKKEAVPESVNREWEQFIEEEESWKKKADYD